MVIGCFHPQSSLRAVNALCDVYDISRRTCVVSVTFGGSGVAGVYHKGCGKIWICFFELSGSSQHMLVCQKFAFNNGGKDDECCLEGRRGVSRKNHFKL